MLHGFYLLGYIFWLLLEFGKGPNLKWRSRKHSTLNNGCLWFDEEQAQNHKAENHEILLHVNSNDRSSSEASGEASESLIISQCKCCIFLSHSGAQKLFVELLCEELEHRRRFPFFDLRDWCLPLGERFPKLIFDAAKQCQLAVVVVSEEYFQSKWPMLELDAFVKAQAGSNSKLKILPLFFGLTISEFKDSSMRRGWFSLWDRWANDDKRIIANDFKTALEVLGSYNGIEFNRKLGKERPYLNNVVSRICTLTTPDVKLDDSHIQGRSNLLKAYCKKIQEIDPSGKKKVHVIGFHGVGGIGKTTMCMTLCNELSLEFDGKVCHVDMGANREWEALLKEVLEKLSAHPKLLQEVKMAECAFLLRERDTWTQKIFLAIDNLWEDLALIEHAEMLLHAPFCDGSVVMVTSRLVKSLTAIGIEESCCFEMPKLGKENAKNLFLQHALRENQCIDDKDNYVIEACVARCYFQQSEKQGFHFLPLALKALGRHFRFHGKGPSDWMKELSHVGNFNHSSGENPVFDTLRVNYDRLAEKEQMLFMDIVLYSSGIGYGETDVDIMEWLGFVHGKNLEDIENQVQLLKEKGLLEDVDINSRKICIHDLYREFAEMESEGKLNAPAFNSRRFVYERGYPTDLERTASGMCWENLIRVGIVLPYGANGDAIRSLNGIQWRCCSNVVVLKLVGMKCVKGVLNLKDLKCLRSLDLQELDQLENLEGLEELSSLIYFKWRSFVYLDARSWRIQISTQLGEFPASLEVLQVVGGVSLRDQDVFIRCTNLRKLKLTNICANAVLDFTNCTSLQNVHLSGVEGLQSLLLRAPTHSIGLADGSASCLQSLHISSCIDLGEVWGLDQLIGLQKLKLRCNPKLSIAAIANLQRLSTMQDLEVRQMNFSDACSW